MKHTKNEHEKQANARLIAAAPEMLNELYTVRQLLAEAVQFIPGMRDDFNRIGKLIVKATGVNGNAGKERT